MSEAGACGLFVAIVGPSGAGKDTLIGGARAALQGDERFVFAQRVVTRMPDANEHSIAADPADFDIMVEGGQFLHFWRAHGLAYGLPAALSDDLRAGRIVIANVSRTVIAEIRERHPASLVVEITAGASILAERLKLRGREAAGTQGERLARAANATPPFVPDHRIENNGDAGEAIRQLVDLLREAEHRIAKHDPAAEPAP
jgi:phosphonate metabolism protein PhnN/1,5-bisphosphokinase (PRPP-forming)